MNANDVIEAYITEIAERLPRKQRNDVAFELRALLQEELHDKAGDSGQLADADMATRLVREFGRPADVAARYRPSLTVIDPADGHAFVRTSAIGMAIIWVLGLVEMFQQPSSPGVSLLSIIGQWWVRVVIASLWWPGVLVVYHGLSSWSRRRALPTGEWDPRSRERVSGGRTAIVMALVGLLFGVSALMDPRLVLDLFWGGRAAPAAYEALTYSDTFLRRQAPWLLGLLLLHAPLWLSVIVTGRWTAALERLQGVLGIVISAVSAWVVLDGPVFKAPSSDQMVKQLLVLFIGVALFAAGSKLLRSVRPRPDSQVRA